MGGFGGNQFNTTQFGAGSLVTVNGGQPVSSLLYLAYRKARILRTGRAAYGQQLSPELQTDGLMVLNQIIDACNADRLFIWASLSLEYTLTAGIQSYTLGPGAQFDTEGYERPSRLIAANVVLNNVNPVSRKPLRLVDDLQWSGRRVVAAPGSTLTPLPAIPLELWDDYAYPFSNLKFWPGPNLNYGLELFTWQQLVQFASVNQGFLMPPGYYRFLVHQLTIELHGMFPERAQGDLPPSVVAIAAEAKATIQALNAPSPRMECDGLPGGGTGEGGFNYLTGDFDL